MHQKLLMPTDVSALSKRAVRNAIGLAAATSAKLVALYVVPRYPVSYVEGAVATSIDDIARTKKAE